VSRRARHRIVRTDRGKSFAPGSVDGWAQDKRIDEEEGKEVGQREDSPREGRER
jgi:hypothetical protein